MRDESREQGQKMVQCEITGQWVPEDEIIEIQGHRVCAAGKEELLQRLKSGERLPGEMERPTFLRRFGCLFLDGIILAIVGFAIQMAIAGTLFPEDKADLRRLQESLFAIRLLGLLVGLAYLTILHGTKGQTIGKMAGRIKVVNPDGSPIGLTKAFVRALVFDGPQLLAPIVILTGSLDTDRVFQMIVGGYVIANLLVMLSDRARHRTIHDRVAGTRVIAID